MCGRYALACEHEALRIRFGFQSESPLTDQHVPRYNIAPSQANPVVTNGEHRQLRPMRWGLIPHWAKDASIGAKMINARAETAHVKPSFRDAFKNHRCLIPATGFYEWETIPATRSKQPLFVSVKDQDIFAFAGLWSCWHDPHGDDVLSYTILTTEPNDYMKSFHHRMPVILQPEHEESWLDPSCTPDRLHEILSPYPADCMAAFSVGRLVNSPRNDSAECVVPTGDVRI